MIGLRVRFIKDSIKYEATIVKHELEDISYEDEYRRPPMEIIECDNIHVDGEEIPIGNQTWYATRDMIMEYYETN